MWRFDKGGQKRLTSFSLNSKSLCWSHQNDGPLLLQYALLMKGRQWRMSERNSTDHVDNWCWLVCQSHEDSILTMIRHNANTWIVDLHDAKRSMLSPVWKQPNRFVIIENWNEITSSQLLVVRYKRFPMFSAVNSSRSHGREVDWWALLNEY